MVLDLARHLTIGGTGIINWLSFAHPAWVITSTALFAVGAWLRSARFWDSVFLAHFVLVLGSMVNQFIPFWDVLTYNCMLFNAIFATVYFLLGAIPEFAIRRET